MIYIKATNLSIGYEQIVVSSDINFEVAKGDYISIVGENGAGKTTLLKTLISLQKPISGKIDFVNNLNNKAIAYLPQKSAIKRDFPATVYEIVLSGTLASNKGFFYSKQSKEKALLNMERMNISHLKNASYKKLSGGQAQRVLLARALCASDEIILLDEPINGLDPKSRLDFYELIKKLNEEGLTIIMISHDINTAIKYSNKILHLSKKQLFFGTTKEYENTDIFKYFISMENMNE